ncbi:MAG: hypothetical protein HYU36_20260 [Planctomycetes bacterium]|nr:hypothetical protein [Planctomycetota bacterium]
MGFLLVPATWIITSLHGNFDVIPAFLTFVAFITLHGRASETSAAVASLLLGLAVMARTFPIVFIFPMVTVVFRRHGWRVALWSASLVVLPTVLSLYPIYLISPDAVSQKLLGYRGVLEGWWGLGAMARLFISDGFAAEVVRWNLNGFLPLMTMLLALVCYGMWQGRISVWNGGLLTALGVFCFAPTISNQNFYFLLPWAFWAAMVGPSRAAQVFLWVLSVDLILVYVVIPLDLSDPIWFQWAYDYSDECVLPRLASPRILVDAMKSFSGHFKRSDFGYNPFIQNVLRIPVWVCLWVWFIGEARKRFQVSGVRRVTRDA